MSKKLKNDPIEVDIHDIEYLVCHVGNLWRKLLGIKIKSLGINVTEKRVLFAIGRYTGLTQIKIANLLELEPQNLIRSLDKLEKLGWIQKCADPDDRRVKCLSLTPQGKKMISQIQTLSNSIKPQILEGFDEKKIQQVVKHLSDMRENLFRELGE
jgi:MarR family transcriptional regulator for hemolysin